MNDWSELPELEEYFSIQRTRPEDLYPSEKFFLPWLARNCDTVLDAGCAVGGFSNIWKHYNTDIVYSGIDLSTRLISAAKRQYAENEFQVANPVEGLPFKDDQYCCVAALGWFHWEPRWKIAMSELWRVSKKYMFFDVRMSVRPGAFKQSMEFAGAENSAVDYIVISESDIVQSLQSLKNVKTILGFGYKGNSDSSVIGLNDEIYFATFVIEKGHDSEVNVAVDMDLFIQWPENWFVRDTNYLRSVLSSQEHDVG